MLSPQLPLSYISKVYIKSQIFYEKFYFSGPKSKSEYHKKMMHEYKTMKPRKNINIQVLFRDLFQFLNLQFKKTLNKKGYKAK